MQKSHRAEVENAIWLHCIPVPSLWGRGGAGGVCPPDDCLCPPSILVYSTVFGTSRNCKTTTMMVKEAEVESSRTSLALRTHFEILGLGLENCSVFGSRTALFFERLKFCRSAEKCFSRPFFLEFDGKIFLKTFLLRKMLAFVFLVLGLEHSCPWPRIFFVPLALASSIVSSTPPLKRSNYV